MALRNSQDSWGSVSKFFHWTLSFSVIIMFIVGVALLNRHDSPYIEHYFTFHETLGLCILAAVLLRIIWRWFNTVPELPETVSPWLRTASRLNHYALYICLIAMPVSGWINASSSGYPPKFLGWVIVRAPVPVSKSLTEVSGLLHEIFAWTLAALITIHILAALKHHFIDKDNVLRRMLPGTSKKPAEVVLIATKQSITS